MARPMRSDGRFARPEAKTKPRTVISGMMSEIRVCRLSPGFSGGLGILTRPWEAPAAFAAGDRCIQEAWETPLVGLGGHVDTGGRFPDKQAAQFDLRNVIT